MSVFHGIIKTFTWFTHKYCTICLQVQGLP